MFNKKKAKKLEVKSETPNVVKINLRTVDECAIAPLVQIEKHETKVNGKDQPTRFRIAIAGRDVLTLTPREYQALFMEMLLRKSPERIIHDIADAHNAEHARTQESEKVLGEIFAHLTR